MSLNTYSMHRSAPTGPAARAAATPHLGPRSAELSLSVLGQPTPGRATKGCGRCATCDCDDDPSPDADARANPPHPHVG